MSNHATVFNQKFGENIERNFKELLDTDLYVDLIFVCRNNVKIGAHQVIMSLMSRFFYEMFIENSKMTREKTIYVYVPDIRSKIMKHILEFVYNGKARLNKTELSEFNEDIKLLGMPLDDFTSANGANVADRNPANAANSVVNPPSITIPQPLSTVTNSPNTKTIVPRTSISKTKPTPQTVAKAVNFNLQPESLTSSHNESIVSSSNTSVPTTPDPSISPTVSSASTTLNSTMTTSLPVIVTAQSFSMNSTSNTELGISAENDPKVGVQGTPGNSVRSQNKTHLEDTAPLSKRRRPNEVQASDLICIDSDDEKDDDVIMLS